MLFSACSAAVMHCGSASTCRNMRGQRIGANAEVAPKMTSQTTEQFFGTKRMVAFQDLVHIWLLCHVSALRHGELCPVILKLLLLSLLGCLYNQSVPGLLPVNLLTC